MPWWSKSRGSSKSASKDVSRLPSPTNEGGKEEKENLTTVHIDQRRNMTCELLVPVRLSEFIWKLNGSSWVTETRTFYLLGDNGEFSFLQLAYTSSGWPVQASFQVTARCFNPLEAKEPIEGRWVTNLPIRRGRGSSDPQKGQDRHAVGCTNHSASGMKLSEDRTGISIHGASISPAPNKRRVDGCYQSTLLGLDFTFEQLCEGATFGNGSISFGVDGGDGTVSMQFIPFGRAQGTITVDSVPRPFKAHGMMLHQFQGIRPNLVASHWQFSLFISDPDETGEITSIFMIEVRTPATYGSATVNYGGFYSDKRLVALCRDGKITHTSPIQDTRSAYYIPTGLHLEWQGVTVDGDSFSANCNVTPRVLCDRMNLLEQLPFVMRKIVETFVTRPYVYQWIDRTQLTVSLGGSSASIEGWVMTELSFLGDE